MGTTETIRDPSSHTSLAREPRFAARAFRDQVDDLARQECVVAGHRVGRRRRAKAEPDADAERAGTERVPVLPRCLRNERAKFVARKVARRQERALLVERGARAEERAPNVGREHAPFSHFAERPVEAGARSAVDLGGQQFRGARTYFDGGIRSSQTLAHLAGPRIRQGRAPHPT